MVLQGKPLFNLWLIATTGNSLGATVNWLLGRYITQFENHRWFPIKPAHHQKAQRLFQRYGIWSLLFSWLPIVGDAFTFIAGIMKVNFIVFLVLTVTGKGLRYMVVIGIAYNVSPLL